MLRLSINPWILACAIQRDDRPVSGRANAPAKARRRDLMRTTQEPTVPTGERYPSLSATKGSTRVARTAGIRLAVIATRPRSPATSE